MYSEYSGQKEKLNICWPWWVGLKMPTFNVGDCAWKLNLYGNRFTVDIVSVGQDEDGTTTYVYVPNGIAWTEEPKLSFMPHSSIPFVEDPCDYKRWSKTKETTWYGTCLTYRAPEPGDDEKRALWQARIKKHEDAIVELRKRCAPFKKGTAVVWHSFWCCVGERPTNGCKGTGHEILKGVVESVEHVASHFNCKVKSADGVSHNTTVWVLGIDAEGGGVT